MKKFLWPAGTSISLIGLFLFLSLTSGGDFLPPSLGSLGLESLQSGEEARAEIDRLHGKRIPFERGTIARYSNEQGKGQLWISMYSSSEKAARATRKMASEIQKGGGEFWHFQEKEILGQDVYMVLGNGQVHYFFQKGVKVIWLAVDPSLARETIRAAVEKIP